MAAPRRNVCLIGVRGTAGISMNDPRRRYGPIEEFPRNEGGQCRVMKFSEDGSLFAFCDGIRVRIVNVLSNEVVLDLDRPRTAAINFSPCGSIIAVWEPYFVSKEQAAGTPNLQLWDLKTGDLLKGFIQKKSDGWCPQWSHDEEISARSVNNEVHFFEKNCYESIHTKLHLQKVASFSIPPKAEAPYHVAVYVPGSKGSPSYVRVYRYPDFSGLGTAVANKSFYKSDKVELIWNNKGNGLLVLTVTDSSAESYYGEQGLHYISLDGESCLVPRPKNGPVYSVVWSPNSTSFCVVYGFMPAKATLYNLKAEPIFDFGTGPRNECHFNPYGNMLVLAGFGALRGNVEFWDLKRQCLISNPGLADTTLFEWCADGVHILSATTAPRLRVGNGFKVVHYSGEIKHEYKCGQNEEIWEARWQPAPEGLFKQPQIAGGNIQVAKGVAPAQARAEEASKSAYVPPALRGESGTTLTTSRPKYREEYEPPSNLKQSQQPENLSKSALKNKKKREAKQRARQEEAQGGASRPQSAAVPAQPAAAAAAAPPSASGGGPGAGLTGDPETDKRIRALRKKIQQIEKIKERQASGQKLELNQVDKLKQEAELIEELESLTL